MILVEVLKKRQRGGKGMGFLKGPPLVRGHRMIKTVISSSLKERTKKMRKSLERTLLGNMWVNGTMPKGRESRKSSKNGGGEKWMIIKFRGQEGKRKASNSVQK